MNRTGFFLGLVLSLSLLADTRADIQSGLIPPAEANRYGLQRIWFTQIEVDVARGRVTHLTQHVSATESTTIYEVIHDKGKFVYRETDLDKFGRVIGKEQAKKLADVKLQDLQILKVDARQAAQTVPRITLYAVTDSGSIQSIDGETGRIRWKTAVGTSRYPTEAVGANDQYAAAINGSEIYLLNATNGELVWQRKVSGAPGAGPAVSDAMVFVPMINGAMEAYPLSDPRLPPVIFKSHGRAMIQPTYTGSNVAWPTDRGHLYVTGGTHHRINFRLEAKNTIVAPASAFPPNRLIASSIDGFIYCLQETAGTLLWRFSAGEPIVAMPVPYGDTVYAVTEDGTLFAIDGDLGQERWSTVHMSQVVGASRDRLYCLSDIGRLTILDRKTGSRIGSLSTEFDDLPYVNRETDRIIVGTSRGLVQCFRETAQEYPIIHIALQKPVEETPKKPPRAQAAEAPKTSADNPFGTGPGTDGTPPPATAPPVDPFGTPPADEGKKADTPPADKKPGEDPFG